MLKYYDDLILKHWRVLKIQYIFFNTVVHRSTQTYSGQIIELFYNVFSGSYVAMQSVHRLLESSGAGWGGCQCESQGESSSKSGHISQFPCSIMS